MTRAKQNLLQTQEQRKQSELNGSLNRALPLNSIREVEGEDRTFIMSFSSEEPYKRWWGVEILDHTTGCVNLERINSIGCMLFNHNRDKVVGRIVETWVDGNRCSAKVQFDDDEQSELIRKKVASGTLKGVSVGYAVDSWENVKPGGRSADGRFTGPCDIAKRWEPFEISIVSVPADPTVGVGRGLENITTGRTLDLYSRQLQINKNKFQEELR